MAHPFLSALLAFSLCSLALPGTAASAASYRVQRGDTLSGIAARAGVTVAQLQAANSRLRGSTAVQAGWVLRVPDRRLPPTRHRVKAGENLSVIAQRYGLSVRALEAANPSWRGRALWVGATLTIPARTASPRLGSSGAASGITSGKATVRPASVQVSPAPRSAGGWAWPVPGHATVSSGYGQRTLGGRAETHYGIDIVAPLGTPVRAARAGRVLESRPDYARGWGWTVVLEHPDGWITRYAHLSANLTRKGEWVVRGQPIGRVGDTGRTTGPHLHYGTYFRWAPRNPLALY